MGHPEKSCEGKIEDSMKDTISEGQYGEWMKVLSNVEGKRVLVSELHQGRRSDLVRKEIKGIKTRDDKKEIENMGEEGDLGSSRNSQDQEKVKGASKEQIKKAIPIPGGRDLANYF